MSNHTLRPIAQCAGYMARSNLDGSHLIVTQWCRLRPSREFSPNDFAHSPDAPDSLRGQRLAWTFRDSLTLKKGCAVILPGGTADDARAALLDFIDEIMRRPRLFEVMLVRSPEVRE